MLHAHLYTQLRTVRLAPKKRWGLHQIRDGAEPAGERYRPWLYLLEIISFVITPPPDGVSFQTRTGTGNEGFRRDRPRTAARRARTGHVTTRGRKHDHARACGLWG